MPVVLRGLMAGLGAWAIVVVLFLVYDLVVSRKERSALLSLGIPFVVRQAMQGVLIARNAFADAVDRYEDAVARLDTSVESVESSQTASAGSAGASGRAASAPGGAPSEQPGDPLTPGVDAIFGDRPKDLLQLEVDKGAARERLLDAQRLWDAIRPGEVPDARHDLWMGSGFMRGWQFGPIGYERAFVRLDHLTDASAWAIWEIRRPRFGFGLGYERQRLALFCLRTSTRQLSTLLGQAFDGPEFAFRPGISPTRTWRRLRRDPMARKANRALLKRHELGQLITGPDPETRAIVTAAFEAELGQPLGQIESLPPGPGLLSIHTKGPSLSFGVWTGPRPIAEMRASSGHTAWQGPA